MKLSNISVKGIILYAISFFAIVFLLIELFNSDSIIIKSIVFAFSSIFSWFWVFHFNFISDWIKIIFPLLIFGITFFAINSNRSSIFENKSYCTDSTDSLVIRMDFVSDELMYLMYSPDFKPVSFAYSLSNDKLILENESTYFEWELVEYNDNFFIIKDGDERLTFYNCPNYIIPSLTPASQDVPQTGRRL